MGASYLITWNPDKRDFERGYGSVRYVCGKCETIFAKSPRCPECGQLIKE